jgi:hypothetical protein
MMEWSCRELNPVPCVDKTLAPILAAPARHSETGTGVEPVFRDLQGSARTVLPPV